MRFMCDVEICNLCLPSYNLKTSGRSSRGFLSIGQKPGSTNKNRTVFLSFCTAKDKSGIQYLVSFYFSLTFASLGSQCAKKIWQRFLSFHLKFFIFREY